jgi:pimeloyl-ACP methyl ester carboxylesterase
MKRLAIRGVEIAYLDEGKGPAVIAGHCSSASHKEWLPLIEALKSDWRVLAPDFIGYGQSEPWPATEPFSIEADVEVLRTIAKKAKGPLHLVGHSYGAALALEAARSLGKRVKSLTLVEPVSFHLLRLEGRPEWAEFEGLSRAVLGAVAKADDREAAKAFVVYWLGRTRWWLSPERFKTAIAATIAGSKTRAPTRAIADLLAGALPNAKLAILPGAGHMSPFTHPAELNRLILDHLRSQR